MSINNKIDLSSIHPFSAKPIKVIPKSVFENCNQVTCNDYRDGYLNLLKDKARTITKEALEKLCVGKERDFFTKKAEEFAWIYGLDVLEKEVLQNDSVDELFDSDTILKYNRLFSRLVGNAGEFRKRDIRWARKDLTVEESIIIALVEKIGCDSSGEQWFLGLNEKKYAKFFELKCSFIRNQLLFFKNHPENLVPEQSEGTEKFLRDNLPKLNPNIVNDWMKEQGRTDGKIDFAQWVNKRFHYFPPHQTIEEKLKELQKEISANPAMHAIEKAARIWLKIVEVHISHEANKRTGKALASIILLHAGYLPPIIGKNDTQEYLDKMKAGFNSEEGRDAFVQYIARKIIETQQQATASNIS